MIIRILYCFIILILFSCVASPRYSSSTYKNTPKKYNSTERISNLRKWYEHLSGTLSDQWIGRPNIDYFLPK